MGEGVEREGPRLRAAVLAAAVIFADWVRMRPEEEGGRRADEVDIKGLGWWGVGWDGGEVGCLKRGCEAATSMHTQGAKPQS